METGSEEKMFMAFPRLGVQEFQKLLIWNINNKYDGVSVNFCRFVSDQLESKFRASFDRPSKISNEGRLWISESTVSRWLRSGNLDIKIQLLNYISATGALLNPISNLPLSVNDLLDVLQGNLTFDYDKASRTDRHNKK